jgi:hypothetical protein
MTLIVSALPINSSFSAAVRLMILPGIDLRRTSSS